MKANRNKEDKYKHHLILELMRLTAKISTVAWLTTIDLGGTSVTMAMAMDGGVGVRQNYLKKEKIGF